MVRRSDGGIVAVVRPPMLLLLLVVGLCTPVLAQPDDLFRVHMDAGKAAMRADRFAEAAVAFRAALGAADGGVADPRVQEATACLATALQRGERDDEALAAVNALIAQAEALLGKDTPAFAEWLRGYAACLSSNEVYRLPVVVGKRALAIFEAAYGAGDARLSPLLRELATYGNRIGERAEAIAHATRAVTVVEKAVGPNHEDLIGPLTDLGRLSYGRGDYETACAPFTRALRIAEGAYGREDKRLVYLLDVLERITGAQQRFGEQMRLAERLVAVQEKALEPGSTSLTYPLKRLADVCGRLGYYDKAEPLLQRRIDLYAATLAQHPDNAGALAFVTAELGDLYMLQERYEDAWATFTKSWEIIGRVPAKPWQVTRATYTLRLARCAAALGRADEQKAWAERSLDFLKAVNVQGYERWKAEATMLAGRFDEAERLYRGPGQPVTHREFAEFYMAWGKPAAAEPHRVAALADYEKTCGTDVPGIIVPMAELARCHMAQGKRAQATDLLARAAKLIEKLGLPNSPWVAHVLADHARMQGEAPAN